MSANFKDEWPEYVSFIFLAIGFFVAVLSRSDVFSFFIVLLTGLAFGRAWWRYHKRAKSVLVMCIAACLAGLIMGFFLRNIPFVILTYLCGIFAGYYIHKRNWINSIEF